MTNEPERNPAELEKPSKAVRIDRDELNALSGVKFDYDDTAELAEITAIYVGRFARRSALPDFIVVDAVKQNSDPRRTERDARRAFVAAVEGIWRDRWRKKGHGSSYQPDAEIHDGPLIRLLQYLLAAAGEKTPPSNSTLHHDLSFLYSARERAGRPTSI